ncbi:MAG: carboxylesterase/lipase family protein [Burkholderiaceae bacterium]
MSVIVQTRYGQLKGLQDRGVQVFRGVPYAQPPTQGLRFRPPQPPQPWTGVRDAREFGPVAPQYAGLTSLAVKFLVGPADEDCLYLNIWTPAADAGRRPVMVWIHGGAFILGAGSQSLYDGAALAQRGDVVVVTINYRLGALGFLRLKELSDGRIPATGNEGILDQIAALEWVRDEIASFGGDPGNVTIFGESAGSMSCATLLGTPRAQGLFHRAILQSGSANFLSSREAATEVAEALLHEMGMSPDEVDKLAEIAPDRLVRGQQRLFGALLTKPKNVFSGRFLSPRRAGVTVYLVGSMSWRLLRRAALLCSGLVRDLFRPADKRRRGRFRSLFAPLLTTPNPPELPLEPVLDHELLPHHPFDAIADGMARKVSLLIGTNLDEMKFFIAMDLASLSLDEKALIARCEEKIPGTDADGVSFGRRAVEVYRAARTARGESVRPRDLWYAIESDRTMRYPAMRLASLQSAHQANTYAYLFTWPSPSWRGALGACHVLELPFMFGALDERFMREFAGSNRPGARELSERMQDAWLRFARTGSPADPSDPATEWPAYDATRRATMILDRECRVEDAPREAERAFWESVERRRRG